MPWPGCWCGTVVCFGDHWCDRNNPVHDSRTVEWSIQSGQYFLDAIYAGQWIHLLNRPGLRRAGWTGLLWAATCLFYWYYGFFTIGAAFILLMGHRWRSGSLSSRTWRMIWTATVAGLALLSPWAIWFFMGWSQIPGTSEVGVFPHPQALKDAVSPGVPFLVGEGRHAGQAMPASIWGLGLVGCILACWTAYRREQSMVGIRHALGLAAVAIIFWLLALGPIVSWAPYNLLYGIAPPLRRFWWPVRHVVLANAAWGVLAALALSSILGRLEGKWRQFLRPSMGLVVVGSVVPLLQFQGAPTKVQLMSVDLDGYLLSPLAELEAGVLMEPPISPEVAGSQQHHVSMGAPQAVDERTCPLVTGCVQMRGMRLWPTTWLTALQEMERGELQGSLSLMATISAIDDKD